MHNKSQHRVFMEILIGGVVGGVVMSALTLGVFRLLINADYQSAAFVVSSVYVGVIVLVMMSLAVFIFYKLKDSRVRAKNEFQRLVGVVSRNRFLDSLLLARCERTQCVGALIGKRGTAGSPFWIVFVLLHDGPILSVH